MPWFLSSCNIQKSIVAQRKIIKLFVCNKEKNSEKITLLDKDDNQTHDNTQIADTLNTYFKRVVKSLEIQENRFVLTEAASIADQVKKLIKKYECHYRIITIKKCTYQDFS